MKWGKRVVGIAATVGILMGLTGCDTGMFQGPLSVRMSDNGVEVALCEPIQATSIEAQISHPGFLYRPWNTFWQERGGPLTLRAGDAVQRGALDPTDSITAAAIAAGDELDITIAGADGGQMSAMFTVPTGGMPTQAWLAPDGSVNEQPCSTWE